MNQACLLGQCGYVRVTLAKLPLLPSANEEEISLCHMLFARWLLLGSWAGKFERWLLKVSSRERQIWQESLEKRSGRCARTKCCRIPTSGFPGVRSPFGHNCDRAGENSRRNQKGF